MAGRNIVDEFFIAIGMDTSDVDKNINALVDNVSGKLKSIAMGVIAPALAAITSGQIVQQFTQEIIQVDRLSESLGINIEKLQQWQGAAEMAGVAGEEVGELFADINDWMTDLAYNDSGPLKDAVEKGLLTPVKNVNGELKNSEQYLMEMADSFRNMSKQEATGIGRQIGIGRADVVAWLQQGSAGINAQLEHVKRLGVYTKEDAKAAKEFTRVSKDLAQTMKMMLLPVYRVLTPIMTKFAEGIAFAAKHVEAFIPLIAALGTKIGLDLIFPGKSLNRVLKKITVNIIRFAKAPWKTIVGGIKAIAAAAKGFLLSPWTIAIGALVAIGILLDDLIGWMNGKESSWGEYWNAIFGGAETAKKVFEDFKNSAVMSFEGGLQSIMGFISVISGGIGGFIDLIQLLINAFIALVTGSDEAWERMMSAARSFDKNFTAVINGLKNMLKGFWKTFEGLITTVQGIVKWGGKATVALAIGDKKPTVENKTDNRKTEITNNTTINGVKGADEAVAAIEKVQSNDDVVAAMNASQ